ncbi:hypothetical protein [Burkholderia multivorans]|uniref:hypothetical protein n=1 Tax=Burkholderia multivorans TaxID=87883 RepID=UPI00075AC97E|nr:hypothetical protein [Burkholderia multivorans]KWH17620.1 hypothetical protein WL98_26965 [Burkholderia multivorans]
MKITDDMLTEWFPISAYDPVHVGMYRITGPRLPYPTFWHWDGLDWRTPTGELANVWRTWDKWAGLKEKHHG